MKATLGWNWAHPGAEPCANLVTPRPAYRNSNINALVCARVIVHLVYNNHGSSIGASLPDMRRIQQLRRRNAAVAKALEIAAECGARVEVPLFKRPGRIFPGFPAMNCTDCGAARRSPDDKNTPVQERKIKGHKNVTQLAAVPSERWCNPREHQQAAAVTRQLLLLDGFAEFLPQLQRKGTVA